MKSTLAFLFVLLVAVASAFGATENFTTWTEVDPYEVLTVSESSVVAAVVTRGTKTYVARDFTAGYFTDFAVRFQWTGGTLETQYSWLLPFALTNTMGDWQDNYYANSFGVLYKKDVEGVHSLSLLHQAPTYAQATTDEPLSVGTTYYIVIYGDYDGGANSAGLYTMYVCTGNYYGETGATLVDTVTLDVPSGEQSAYRYAGVCLSRSNSSGSYSNGTVANLEFLGESEDPPAKAADPSPADDATGVVPGAQLTWGEADGADSYNIYFGESGQDINFVGASSSRTYLPTLNYATTYNWRVDSVNTYGTTTGDVWAFTTADAPADPNDPNGVIGTLEDFATYAEYDPGSHITVVDANYVTAEEVPGSGTYMLVKDFGPAYWNGSFTARWRSSFGPGFINGATMTMFSLQNNPVGFRDLMYGEDAQLVRWWVNGSTVTVVLEVYANGVTTSDSVAVDDGQEYWFTWVRDEDAGVSGQITLYVCTGAHYGAPDSTLVDTLAVAIPVAEQNDYRYVMLLQNKSTAGASILATTEVSYLDLGIPSETGTGGTGGEPGDPAGHGPYYVSPYGSNDFSGDSEPNAWRTLDFALANATLDANAPDNVIYLMPGDHGAVSLSTKTWASTSWDDKWTITCQTGASLGTLAVHVHDAFLEFNGVNVIRTTSHDENGSVVEFEGTSDVRLRNSYVRGYWDAVDSLYTSGFGVHIRTRNGSYVENIEVNDVSIEDVWCGLKVAVWSTGEIRNGIRIYDTVLKNRNSTCISFDWPLQSRDAYDQVEIHRFVATEQTRLVVESSQTGWPHANGLSGRADNWLVDGFVVTNFGGSGGIRLYEHAYPSDAHFSNITVANCVVYGAMSTIARFLKCGENVFILNNTFVSAKTDASTLSYRYLGSVTLGPSTNTGITPSIKFSNNIVGAILDVGDLTNVDVYNNIVYSVLQGGAWQSSFGDANNVVICKGATGPIADGYTTASLETPGVVFYGASNFADYFPVWDISEQVWLSGPHQPADWTVFNVPETSVAVDAGIPSQSAAHDVLNNDRDATPDIGAFEYLQGVPPARARDPNPVDGATGVSVNTSLQWGGVADDWDLYLGTSEEALVYVGNQQSRQYDEYVFSGNTTYYWRVDANNTYGLTPGVAWSFTTGTTLPDRVATGSPVNGATNVATSRSLTWTPAARAASYDVYLNGSFLTATTTTSAAVTLSEATSYTWRVDSINSYGKTTGTTWSFMTYNPAQGGEPGTPMTPSLPAPESVSVRSPAERSVRPNYTSKRYLRSQETLQAFEAGYTGLPGSYALEEYSSGYVQRIVVVPSGSDTDWSLTVTDSWGAPILSATGLSMVNGVLTYDVDNLPFADGLVITIADTESETVDGIYMRFYVREVVTGY